jgi:hypothetical protein
MTERNRFQRLSFLKRAETRAFLRGARIEYAMAFNNAPEFLSAWLP